MKADIVIFDPATVRDTATFEKPHPYAEGFSHVIVNGQVVFENGDDDRRRGPGACCTARASSIDAEGNWEDGRSELATRTLKSDLIENPVFDRPLAHRQGISGDR